MEEEKINQCHNDFLVPEMVRRVNVCCKKKENIPLSKVTEVIGLKREFLKKLTEENRQLSCISNTRKLEVKSKHIKRMDVNKGFLQKMNIAMKCYESCKELDLYLSTSLEKFEEKMKLIDAKFLMPIEKYSKENLKDLIDNTELEIKRKTSSIQEVVYKFKKVENIPTDLLVKIMPTEKVEDDYGKIAEDVNNLQREIDEVERELKSLKQETYFAAA